MRHCETLSNVMIMKTIKKYLLCRHSDNQMLVFSHCCAWQKQEVIIQSSCITNIYLSICQVINFTTSLEMKQLDTKYSTDINRESQRQQNNMSNSLKWVKTIILKWFFYFTDKIKFLSSPRNTLKEKKHNTEIKQVGPSKNEEVIK